MPKYTYKCETCEETKEVWFQSRNEKKEVVCAVEEHGKMKKIPSSIKPAIIKERDAARDKNFKRDLNKDLKERSHKHFVKNIMPDLLAQEKPKEAEKNGWVDKSGKKKTLIDEK